MVTEEIWVHSYSMVKVVTEEIRVHNHTMVKSKKGKVFYGQEPPSACMH